MGEKIKVFALFRNNASYIDPLLENFGNNPLVELMVAFCVNKRADKTHLEKIKHVFLSNSDNEKYYESGDCYLFQKDVIKYAKDFNPDVIFLATSYFSPTTWIVVKYAKKNKIPIFTRMTVESKRKRNIVIKAIKKIIVSLYCKKANAGVYECVNQKDYMNYYGISSDKLFFAPCAVDNDYYYELKKKYNRDEIRKEIGIDNDSIVLSFSGQLIQRKRPLDILAACQKLDEKGISYKMIFMGDGVLRQTMESFISDNGMEDKILLTGKLNSNDMSKYLSASDIYIMASENDASPKALNEAMNFELPIVISDGIETSKEMCKEGENGYIFGVGEVDELANDIMKIIEQGPHQMGMISRQIVSKYSFDRVVEAWIQAANCCLQQAGKIKE